MNAIVTWLPGLAVAAKGISEIDDRPIAENKKGPHMCGPSNFGSPTWARTRDLRINSPALYRLSYRGTAVQRVAT
ncbi:hypothetical protein PSAB6_90085 [Paraburkholderia sabiae]|nr:hypothetical protein PSAB6_90085 [Paraburkholderia sabiae]